MAIIAHATVESQTQPWTGQIQSGKHQFVTDKPESFGGQDLGDVDSGF